MKFTILVDPSLVYDLCLRVRRRFFKKYINFTLYSPKIPPLGVGVGQ